VTIDNNLLKLKAIAEKSRIMILNCLLDEPQYVEKIAQALQLSPATVSLHMKKLVEAQLVTSRKEQYYTIYEINRKQFEMPLIDFVRMTAEEKEFQQERIDRYHADIVKNHIRPSGVRLPKQRKKRLIVLREIVNRYFETEREYTEKEVNHIFVDIGIDDFCFARRSMIDERLMERQTTENGSIYRIKQ
jgi:hypothetical protein